MTPESQTSSAVQEPPQTASEAGTLLTVAQESGSVGSPGSQQASLTMLAGKLPLQLDLRIPLPSFRVQNLLSLEKGQVIESAWPHTEDLPLWSGGVHLVWAEFEVVDQKLAVRVTRLV
jgi:flagellar motor switch protein FliM